MKFSKKVLFMQEGGPMPEEQGAPMPAEAGTPAPQGGEDLALIQAIYTIFEESYA